MDDHQLRMSDQILESFIAGIGPIHDNDDFKCPCKLLRQQGLDSQMDGRSIALDRDNNTQISSCFIAYNSREYRNDLDSHAYWSIHIQLECD